MQPGVSVSARISSDPMADSGAKPGSKIGGRQRPIVQWYGTHPAENIASMDVYRESLLREISPDDDFEIRCWPPAGSWNGGLGGCTGKGPLSRFVRAIKKYSAYARRVRNTPACTAVVHLLDHSMAHLLPDVPVGMKTVVTVHDLIPLSYPGELTPSQQKRFLRNVENLRCADAIIAVSEFTKSEIVEHLGIDPERITVVPNGVSVPDAIPNECAAVNRLRANGADAVLLSVGTTLQRKNLQILPAALKVAAEKSGKRLGLLRIGDLLNADLANELQAVLGEGGLIELGRVDEPTLWSAYRAADVLIFPSLYEGFGLPVLEALACGTAVACSDRTSLPEVGGEVVEYFDPDCDKATGAAVLTALEKARDPSCQSARSAHAAGFSWRSHWIDCDKVYRNLLR
jgi:glycosyltransferase involved in cell wall biosynthesis